jgi:hypothetical protein
MTLLATARLPVVATATHRVTERRVSYMAGIFAKAPIIPAAKLRRIG